MPAEQGDTKTPQGLCPGGVWDCTHERIRCPLCRTTMACVLHGHADLGADLTDKEHAS